MLASPKYKAILYPADTVQKDDTSELATKIVYNISLVCVPDLRDIMQLHFDNVSMKRIYFLFLHVKIEDLLKIILNYYQIYQRILTQYTAVY